jgi:hypothetical protein
MVRLGIVMPEYRSVTVTVMGFRDKDGKSGLELSRRWLDLFRQIRPAPAGRRGVSEVETPNRETRAPTSGQRFALGLAGRFAMGAWHVVSRYAFSSEI